MADLTPTGVANSKDRSGDRTDPSLETTRRNHLEGLENLGVVAGTLAHELNNLLVGIMGFTSLASLEAEPGSPIEPHLQKIATSAERMSELTKDVVSFSSNHAPVRRRMALNELVAHTAALYQFGRDHVLPDIEYAADAGYVRVDVFLMTRALSNVLINAREASGEGGVLRVRTGTVDLVEPEAAGLMVPEVLATGPYSYVDVTDTGGGVARDIAQRMFSPFVTTKGRGRGIGLTAVARIVGKHDGGVFVWADDPPGTTVRIALPREGRVLADGLIVVIDPDASFRSMAKTVVERAGHSCAVAAGLEEAFSLIAATDLTVAAVVCDAEALLTASDELRRHLSETAPLILMSSSDAEAAQAFSHIDPVGRLRKPLAATTLVSELRRATTSRWGD